MKKKAEITVDTKKCTGCLVCALHCSYTKQGLFNPMKAYIRISTCLDEPNKVFFTNDCDSCGICAHFCPYGCLGIGKKETYVKRA